MRAVCGLDVHKDSVFLCIVCETGEIIEKVFGVLTYQLEDMRRLMQSYGVVEVTMESTSVYWIPVWRVLEPHFRLKLVNPYFTLVPSVKKALKRAIRRGVKVEIMVSAKSDVPLTPDCVLRNAYKMKKYGAHVWLYQPGFHHSKIFMADGRYCTVGSANLDARSMRFDYEENAAIIDKATTRELEEMFNNDKLESVYLTKETWNECRTTWQKFRGWFASLLWPWL